MLAGCNSGLASCWFWSYYLWWLLLLLLSYYPFCLLLYNPMLANCQAWRLQLAAFLFYFRMIFRIILNCLKLETLTSGVEAQRQLFTGAPGLRPVSRAHWSQVQCIVRIRQSALDSLDQGSVLVARGKMECIVFVTIRRAPWPHYAVIVHLDLAP